MKKNINTILLVAKIILISMPANSQKPQRKIEIPSKIYREIRSIENTETTQIYGLKAREIIGDNEDTIYYCKGNIWFCGHQDNISPLFWYDNEGNPRQFDFTYTPKPKKIGKWHGYYTFVACQWGGANGEHINYGGECYSQVMSDGKNTIGFLLALGELKEKWSFKNKKIRYLNNFYFNK